MYYLNLASTNPYYNLAAEQYVFDVLSREEDFIMLWQNSPSVIIGRYQNAYAEVNERVLARNDIKLVRRLSGGGAVYHDMGNVNFTFISKAPEDGLVNLRPFCEAVSQALLSIGVESEISGRNDISIAGKKFSGNAQYVKDGRVMHHGTLMYSSNLDILESILKPDPAKFVGKGIKSVRSRVTNISEHMPGPLSVEQFKEALLSALIRQYPAVEYRLSSRDDAEIKTLSRERYSTEEWNRGRSPECTVIKSARIENCGKVEVYITINKGIISNVGFGGDFFSSEPPDELSRAFLGCEANASAYTRALENVQIDRYISGLTNTELLLLLCDKL